jgi:hypothetical protein
LAKIDTAKDGLLSELGLYRLACWPGCGCGWSSSYFDYSVFAMHSECRVFGMALRRIRRSLLRFAKQEALHKALMAGLLPGKDLFGTTVGNRIRAKQNNY